ncbi:unnamed protein product [Calypogeia fissa]
MADPQPLPDFQVLCQAIDDKMVSEQAVVASEQTVSNELWKVDMAFLRQQYLNIMEAIAGFVTDITTLTTIGEARAKFFDAKQENSKVFQHNGHLDIMCNINAALAPGLEVGVDIPQFPATPHDLSLLNGEFCDAVIGLKIL